MKQSTNQPGGTAKEADECTGFDMIAARLEVRFANILTEWQTPLQVVVRIEEFRACQVNIRPDFKGIKTNLYLGLSRKAK